jgi:hypothetical protein
MARCGKIARLPRTIRDELNRRLDDGEQGKGLLEWLNGLPEVKAALDKEFEGRLVSHCNLTEWRKGGFREWREQQETLAVTREFLANGSDFGTVSDEVVRNLESAAVAEYAAALQRSNKDPKEDPRKRFERARKSLLDVVRLRRCEQAREHVEIRREWLELERQRIQQQKNPGATEPPANCNEIQPMTQEEQTELLKELLMPEELAPESR